MLLNRGFGIGLLQPKKKTAPLDWTEKRYIVVSEKEGHLTLPRVKNSKKTYFPAPSLARLLIPPQRSINAIRQFVAYPWNLADFLNLGLCQPFY